MAIIGGVLPSTLLKLFLVPAMYTYLDDLHGLLGGFRLPTRHRATKPAFAGVTGMPPRPAEERPMAGGEEP